MRTLAMVCACATRPCPVGRAGASRVAARMALPSKPATHQPTVVLADDKERIRAPVKLTSLRAGKPRRQPQRWTEERVVSELRAFIARHGDEGIMPTRFCLESHDRSDLAVAIERRFGGLRKLASRMDLAMTGRHEQRHWSSFEVVERALRDFIAANGTRDLMPSSLQLREHGRNDLLLAIRSHGGLRAVANRTGMRLRPALLAKRFDWADWDVLASELFAFVATNGTSGVMPSAAELRTLAGAAVVVEGRSVRVGASGVVQWSGVYALGDLCAVVVISELLVH